MDTVRRELKTEGFTDQDIDLGGLRVTSTFDRRAQRAAVRAVREERPRENARNVHIGLSAVQPGTGAVVAMYGGPTAGGLNQATQARVQPGSAFKPFALAGALTDDIGLRSRFDGNSPFQLPGTDKEVNNEFDRSYGSSVDLVTATELSINTAYVDLTTQMGASKVVEGGSRCRHPRGHPRAGVQRGQHVGHGLGAQHRHGQRLRDVRGTGAVRAVVHRAGGEGLQRRHAVQGEPEDGERVRRGRHRRRRATPCSRW